MRCKYRAGVSFASLDLPNTRMRARPSAGHALAPFLGRFRRKDVGWKVELEAEVAIAIMAPAKRALGRNFIRGCCRRRDPKTRHHRQADRGAGRPIVEHTKETRCAPGRSYAVEATPP